MRNVTGYSNKIGQWRLSCSVRRLGVPREIKEVKWFRNGILIVDQAGFEIEKGDLFIKVGILCLIVKCRRYDFLIFIHSQIPKLNSVTKSFRNT